MSVNLDVQAVSAMLAVPYPDGTYQEDMQAYLSTLAARR